MSDKKAEITFRQVADLIPYVNNPRTHSDDQVAVIAGSIREFGWTNPVLIDGKNGIIAGHGRVLAARKLGLAEVPCIELSHLSEAQRRAYVIADNQTALRAGWSDELLHLELGELQALDFNLDLLGFEPDALDALLAPVGLPQGQGHSESGKLADRFGIPPFSVLNAREGWWQERKAAWIALGIQSELGRGQGATWGDSEGITEPGLNHYRNLEKAKAANGKHEAGDLVAVTRHPKANATPGGGLMPAADYSKGQRGDGKGRPIG